MKRNRVQTAAEQNTARGIVNAPPIVTARGTTGVPYATLRPLLVGAGDDTLTAVCVAYDAALERLAEHAERRPPDPADLDEAYRAEMLAAAQEGREPTLSHADVQAAEAAEVDHSTMLAALRGEVDRHNRRLGEAIRDAGAALVHVLAVERARLLAAGSDPLDTQAPRSAADVLYLTMLWPPLAYGPGHFSSRREPVLWWPPTLDRGAWKVHAGQRTQYNEWAWAMLALPGRKGYTITDAGELQFAAVWEPVFGKTAGRAGVAVAGRGIYQSPMVMFGTGPNGEQGITDADLPGGLQPVTYG